MKKNPPHTLSGIVRLVWICPAAISSYCRSYPSLPVPLTISSLLPLLSPHSFSPSSPFPPCQSPPLIPLQDVQVKLWLCFVKTVPRFKANKLAANYLSGGRCWNVFTYSRTASGETAQEPFSFNEKSLFKDFPVSSYRLRILSALVPIISDAWAVVATVLRGTNKV